ncbi:response regulator transcription factor [Vibrio sp. R78045]|uniref:response regulator transcription factor n=1 Tax=Vibrio sp. R78045 TaxID=3093868 RepID=UPI0036F3189E
MKVLIVDDNHHVVETIADYLEMMGVIVDCAYHGEAALQLIKQQHYDVIVMDVMMPNMDGIMAVKTLRSQLYCQTPTLFLTAKDTLEDKMAAFKAGGDDYLLKPFAMEELFMRLQALSVRGPRLDTGILTFADIEFDTQTETVTRARVLIKLSRIQTQILKVLLQNPSTIVTRQQIITSIWGEESPNSDSLRSHIYGLRTSLDKDFTDTRLETIHGQGYRLKK